MNMPPEIAVALVSALLNGAVTWGVVSTKLAWLRRDIDEARADLAALRRQLFTSKELP
jgi:hypothetical protein